MAKVEPTLIPLENIDPVLIEQLLDRAFGEDRHERTAYKIREGMDWLPGLSFAALDDEGYLVGTIQVWPVALTDTQGRAHPMLMVGPVAVVPERQGEGFGQALMLGMMGSMNAEAPLPLVLIGDHDYYGRLFGFSAEHTGGWTLPGPWNPDRLLVQCTNPLILPHEGVLGPWRR
ncbi:N-acetyltransferase [Altericroceibacterium spongiae]|uniref:N-acetyltransferase n=1 Tax=Altericroceibacterium spongiae TaxID=2320269 RepID=A0A420EMI6_9SPHN|nr:N-acetyltransferase [Altericroceibacterium spongiae]RKF21935.1 N-acetyltransferase [Altericroceibacterium spongiae]